MESWADIGIPAEITSQKSQQLRKLNLGLQDFNTKHE